MPIRAFNEHLREALQTKNAGGSWLEMCRTPLVYRLLGFPDAPLMMTPKVAIKIRYGKQGERAEIPEALMCRLPVLLDDPVLVYESFELGCVVAVTDARDSAGNLIVSALDKECLEGYRKVNLCLTVYGKQSNVWYENQANLGRLLYANRAKCQATPEVSNLPLLQQNDPGRLGTSPSARRILLPEDLDNHRKDLAEQARKLRSEAKKQG